MIDIPSIHYDMPADVYRAEPGVSNSYLSRLESCPAAALVPSDETEAMRIGTAFHSFILDGMAAFSCRVVVAPELNLRTKDGKAELAIFQEANKGKTIIGAEDLKNIIEMDKAVKSHPFAKRIIGEGANEVSIFWNDPFSGLNCKARPDKTPGERVLIDLKSCSDASERGFINSVVSYGYARQGAMYLDGMRFVTGEEYDVFCFIAVEKKPPYHCEVYVLSQGFIEYGRNDYQRLMTIETRCRMNNEWPNYTTKEVIELEIPKWLR